MSQLDDLRTLLLPSESPPPCLWGARGAQVRSPYHRIYPFSRAFCPGIVCDKTTVITVYKKGRLSVLHFTAEGDENFFFPLVQDTVALVFAVRLAT